MLAASAVFHFLYNEVCFFSIVPTETSLNCRGVLEVKVMAAFRLQATFSSFGSRSDSPFSGTSPRCMGFGFIVIDGFTEQLALTYFNNGVD